MDIRMQYSYTWNVYLAFKLEFMLISTNNKNGVSDPVQFDYLRFDGKENDYFLKCIRILLHKLNKLTLLVI